MLAKHSFKILLIVGVLATLYLQARLWSSDGGYAELFSLQERLSIVEGQNEALKHRNEEAYGEVDRLKHEPGAIEAVAREELGFVGKDEIWVQIINAPDPTLAPKPIEEDSIEPLRQIEISQ